jgi:hypothetical protein
MKNFGASIQARTVGDRHQTRTSKSMMAEIEITMRSIIVLRAPAVGHIESAQIRPPHAADLR